MLCSLYFLHSADEGNKPVENFTCICLVSIACGESQARLDVRTVFLKDTFGREAYSFLDFLLGARSLMRLFCLSVCLSVPPLNIIKLAACD